MSSIFAPCPLALSLSIAEHLEEKEERIVSDFKRIFQNRESTTFFSLEEIETIEKTKNILKHCQERTFVALARIVQENYSTASPFFKSYKIRIAFFKPSKKPRSPIKINPLLLIAKSEVLALLFFHNRKEPLTTLHIDTVSKKVFSCLKNYLKGRRIDLESFPKTFFPLFKTAFFWQIPDLQKACKEEIKQYCEKKNKHFTTLVKLTEGVHRARDETLHTGNTIFKRLTNALVILLKISILENPPYVLCSVLPKFSKTTASFIASEYLQKNLTSINSHRDITIKRFFAQLKAYSPRCIETEHNPFEAIRPNVISSYLQMLVSKENVLDLMPLKDFAKCIIPRLPKDISGLILSCPSLDNLDLFQITSQCRKLELFMLKNSKITSPAAFIGMPYLKKLSLSHNPHLTSLQGIDSLESLTHLDLSHTNIKDYTGLGSLKNLKVLRLKGIKDLANPSLQENVKLLIENDNFSLQILTTLPLNFLCWHNTKSRSRNHTCESKLVENFEKLSLK